MPAAQEKITPQTQEQQTEFKTRLDNLLLQEITVENINYIADESLDAVIDIAGGCINDYRQNLSPAQQEGIKQLQPAEQEEAAFRHYGLGSVPEVLDMLQEKVDGIHQIDNFLQALPEEDFVVLPPDSSETNLGSGSGEYERAEITPRLKTLLFIANQSLGIDLKDITVTKGTNTSEMMRQESYVGVEIPELDRLVLVCDEQGNATYVFDSKALEQQSLAVETLLGLSKQELNSLLKQHVEVGIRLVYGPQWAGRIANLLTNDLVESSKNEPTEPVILLERVEKAPKDVLSINKLAKELGIDYSATRNVITSLQETMPEEFGKTKTYQFGSKSAEGFSLKQQNLVEHFAKDRGLLAPQASEDVSSATTLAKEIGIGIRTVQAAIAHLQENTPEEFGETKTYRFGPNSAEGFSSEQQVKIKAQLESEGKLTFTTSQDVLNIKGLTKQLEVGTERVQAAIAHLQENTPEEFGDVQTYRFGNRSVEGFTPRQQDMIRDYLESEGLLASPAPKGVLSAHALGKELGAKGRTVHKIGASLQETAPEVFGEVHTYRFGSQRTEGFSPAQQELIRDHLRELGRAALSSRNNQEN